MSLGVVLGLLMALAPPSGFAATFVVDDTTDAVDAAAGDGTCATAAGSCTLRAAIQEANALLGSDEITLPAGEYALAIPGPDEDDAATGDLDVTASLSIVGAGAASTAIDGARLDRVLDVTPTGTAVITGVTIRNGSAASGAGIRIAGGTLQLTDGVVHGNEADDLGGGIANELGVLALVGSTLSDNVAHSSGGGIDNAGTAWITNSTLSGNVADVIGGGLCNVGTATLSNATIAGNTLSGIDNDGQLVVRNTILAENAGPDCTGLLTSHGFNLIQNPDGCLIDGDTSGNLIGMDPALALLEDSGGPTPTHALLAGSAALDTGNPAKPGVASDACETTDQRGVPRPQGFRCDIGAFEASTCGNGVTDAGEACEDGNLTDGDGCDSNCTTTACGNGVVTAGEQCDDGNQTDGDGCSAECRSATGSLCGNGVADTDEACDDANDVNGDGCDSNCTVTACGNGMVTVGEQCDDGNITDGDDCSTTCEAERPLPCGDGTIDPDEACDDGNLTDGDGCDSNCTTTACGNGIVTEGEGCDDGNQTDGDGCAAGCQLESGNAAPDCSAATADPDLIWPPTDKFVPVDIDGVVEPDGDPTTITIVRIAQDEPVISSFAGAFTRSSERDGRHGKDGDKHEDDEEDESDEEDEADGDDDEDDFEDDETDDDGSHETGTCWDGAGIGTSTASVRAERDENGDGRVYHVTFRADDGRGGQCTGTVTVCVPQDMADGGTCVDQGPIADATPSECPAVCSAGGCDGDDCDPATHFLSIECVLETPCCEDEAVPGGITKRLDKALDMLEHAFRAENSRRERKLVKKALRLLVKANRIAWGAARRGTVSAECAAELRGMLYEAKTRTVSWLRSVSGGKSSSD